MRVAFFGRLDDDGRALLRRRLTGGGLAIAVELLIVLVLIWFGAPQFVPMARDGRPLLTFNVSNVRADTEKTTRQVEQRRRAAAPPPKTLQPPRPPSTDIPLTSLSQIPGLMVLTREQYAAADISKIKGRTPKSDGDAIADAPDSQAIGAGPNGQPLYAAQWYREPTQAEMGPYLPRNGVTGWGEIACRTAPRYRVEDCRILGDSPPGSGIARAAQAAAWQFKVIPPRKGGKELIGAWVQIHLDLTPNGAR